jgi:hypothetical protein
MIGPLLIVRGTDMRRCEYRSENSSGAMLCVRGRDCDICRNCASHCPRHSMIRELGVKYLGSTGVLRSKPGDDGGEV